MSRAVELVTEARRMGALIQLGACGEVRMRARQPLAPDLLEGLRQHKAEIKRHLEAERRILHRLRSGTAWLTEVDRRLRAVQDRDERLLSRFVEVLDAWDHLEKLLRVLYDYQRCILSPGQGCPDDAPVACRYCGQTNVPYWIEE